MRRPEVHGRIAGTARDRQTRLPPHPRVPPVKVPKRRSSFSSLPCSRIITHAEMLFLCTSSPQHRECSTSIHTFFLDAAGAAARKGSSPTCSLVAESHNSLCLCAAGCKLYRGFEIPVMLRSRPATPTPIFIPCCGLEKAMCNSIENAPAPDFSVLPKFPSAGAFPIQP